MVDVQNLGYFYFILSIKAAFLQPILQCLIRSSYKYYNKKYLFKTIILFIF